MDASNYKDLTTTRGVVYHYFVSAPQGDKPTLLLLHGFPSTSYDWRHQIAFFRTEGYGLIVPDMLGYGGTSKPTDPEAYKSSLLTKDIIEILDAEKVDKAIAIAHDWGSKVASRLANYYPERFAAFAFLCVGYMAPSPFMKFEDLLALTKQVAGYELIGYWGFFSEDGADKIIEDHFDSFQSIIYPNDTTIWKENLAPSGTLKAWLQADRRTEKASYLSDEEVQIQISELRKSGMAGALNWYKIMTSDLQIDFKDNQGIPKENIPIQTPVFLGVGLKDLGPAEMQKVQTAACAKDLTVHEYEVGHWVQLEAKDGVNRDLLAWIKAL